MQAPPTRQGQAPLRQRRVAYVNTWAGQLALREVRAHLGQQTVLAGLVATAVLMGLAGPFGTFDHLALIPRLVYWAVVVFATYGAGTLVDALMRQVRPDRDALRVGVGGVTTGLVVTGLLTAINTIVFGTSQLAWANVLSISVYAIVISLVVSVAIRVLSNPGETQPPPVLNRLPLHLRGQLLALSVQDHYVEVITDAGADLVLMRLGDAIGEAAPEPGLQVHRSHWVATAAVRSARRKGDGAVLHLANGRDIPVSRSRLPQVVAAGLLPR